MALALSLALHASVLAPWMVKVPPIIERELQVSFVAAPEPEASRAKPDRAEPPPAGPSAHPGQARPKPASPTPPDEVKPETVPAADPTPLPPSPDKKPASMPAPPPPTAEEWQQASIYKLKNGKRYRYAWGQQVRSMMGTAVEGPDQGLVRFRIEIAPDGKVARVEELWSTSEVASKRAWEAIRSLPPLPPTPTGKPLVFEQTIAFVPFETGWPPSYKLDCLPDPPAFRNPLVWNGRSPMYAQQAYPTSDTSSSGDTPSSECDTDSTADSIEEEGRELKRQMDQWRWGR